MSEESCRPLLYHYTDATGLAGILESSRLWATDAQFLNDAQELRYGRQELREALVAEAEKIASPDDEYGADSNRAGIMRAVASNLDEDHESLLAADQCAYVACFCENGDLLSQWRGYAPGGGFAIGFSQEKLFAVPKAQLKSPVGDDDGHPLSDFYAAPVDLAAVRYGQAGLDQLLTVARGEVAQYPSGHPGSAAYSQTMNVILPALARVKDPAFAEEREWRLIVMAPPTVEELQFRTGAWGLIPYLSIEIPGEAIVEVVVGPGAHAELRERGVTRLLAKLKQRDVRVRRSRTPFRG